MPRIANPLARCRPLADRVVVRLAAAQRKTDGGIILPDSHVRAARPYLGRIVAKGTKVSAEIAVGQPVLVERYAGAMIDDEAHESGAGDYCLLREESVLAILEEEDVRELLDE